MIAAGILGYYWIDGKNNPADIVSKHWGYQQVWTLLKTILFYSGDTMDLIDDDEKAEMENRKIDAIVRINVIFDYDMQYSLLIIAILKMIALRYHLLYLKIARKGVLLHTIRSFKNHLNKKKQYNFKYKFPSTIFTDKTVRIRRSINTVNDLIKWYLYPRYYKDHFKLFNCEIWPSTSFRYDLLCFTTIQYFVHAKNIEKNVHFGIFIDYSRYNR